MRERQTHIVYVLELGHQNQNISIMCVHIYFPGKHLINSIHLILWAHKNDYSRKKDRIGEKLPKMLLSLLPDAAQLPASNRRLSFTSTIYAEKRFLLQQTRIYCQYNAIHPNLATTMAMTTVAAALTFTHKHASA